MKALVTTIVLLFLIYITCRVYCTVNLAKGFDKMIANGAVILDVRTETEFKSGHIHGAVNIPLSHLRTDSIPFDTNCILITCCSHGLRSVKAVDILHNRGFEKVYNGGAWSDLKKYTVNKPTN